MYKRILIVLGILVIGSIAFLVLVKKDKSITVNSTAVTRRVIVLDAGHGCPDFGAKAEDGTTEEYINLQIALKLQRLLEQSGAIVVLTRSDENGIYGSDANTIREKKISDIHNRVELGNGEDVDCVVSIHLNKFEDSKYSGWQSFYQEKNEDSKTLAEDIQESIKDVTGVENNRIAHSIKDIYLMDHIDNPTVIVECGFLSNVEELERLKTDEYQEKLAFGIYIGMQRYFNNKW